MVSHGIEGVGDLNLIAEVTPAEGRRAPCFVAAWRRWHGWLFETSVEMTSEAVCDFRWCMRYGLGCG